MPLLYAAKKNWLITCLVQAYGVQKDGWCKKMIAWLDKAVFGMALLRIISGSIEITAALIMIKLNEVSKALMVNSLLAIVGPLVLLTTTTIGLVGLSDRISWSKIMLIMAGVSLILYAIRK